MIQSQTTLTVQTSGQGFTNITREINAWVRETGIRQGLLTVFIQHTSASLTIQENADPDVMKDLATFLKQIAPEDPALYRHSMEGPDDMPAHIRTSLTDVSLTIPVAGGKPVLGTWQGLYVCEHRTEGSGRRVVLHVAGEQES